MGRKNGLNGLIKIYCSKLSLIGLCIAKQNNFMPKAPPIRFEGREEGFQFLLVYWGSGLESI